jgi:hypothetical protein
MRTTSFRLRHLTKLCLTSLYQVFDLGVMKLPVTVGAK